VVGRATGSAAERMMIRRLTAEKLIRSLPEALRHEPVVLLVDDDGQTGADLEAIHVEMARKQDEQVAAKNVA
jgi:hypothetical protein